MIVRYRRRTVEMPITQRGNRAAVRATPRVPDRCLAPGHRCITSNPPQIPRLKNPDSAPPVRVFRAYSAPVPRRPACSHGGRGPARSRVRAPPRRVYDTRKACIMHYALHNRDLELFSTLSMAREFISDYAVTISRDRIVVPKLAEKSAFFSHVRNELFKN